MRKGTLLEVPDPILKVPVGQRSRFLLVIGEAALSAGFNVVTVSGALRVLNAAALERPLPMGELNGLISELAQRNRVNLTDEESAA